MAQRSKLAERPRNPRVQRNAPTVVAPPNADSESAPAKLPAKPPSEQGNVFLIWYFAFFLISGFCSVLYELIWLRLAMAQFGVTTAMVSIVLSVFMAGLGLGSWASGRWLAKAESISALRLYAMTELLIGISAIVVPYELLWGRGIVEHSGFSSSFLYYCLAGLWVAFTLLPWCTLMGATMPLGMQAIAQTRPTESNRSFSYLYMANVAGAVVGTIAPLLLIEILGFRGTLRVGALFNAVIAVAAFVLSLYARRAPSIAAEAVKNNIDADSNESAVIPEAGDNGIKILGLLFLSGLSSMAMEVVWVRCYTPYFGTVVYAFASILGVYLLATFIGSLLYRRWSRQGAQENPVVWSVLATSALLPLFGASPALSAFTDPQGPHLLFDIIRLVLGIALFTGLLGFLTPMLVDRFSRGSPERAGYAYATNVVGCILGPLVAGFGLLPFLSERWGLVILTAPWLIIGLRTLRPSAKMLPEWRFASCGIMAVAGALIIFGQSYSDLYPQGRILRDETATVIATGSGMDKQLLVNGYGMTNLNPITKMMAHLPLASLDRTPQDALVICFGMGTTFRALHSWGIPVTAVELVPSVPRLFSYYHNDGESILASPLSHVVIDDGRRFLERTNQQYDVITIDPPPPLETAGSSLLYSEEFYRLARRHLRPGGILQQWLPLGSVKIRADAADLSSIAHSLANSFPYIRAFLDREGFHFLCSDRPIPVRNPDELMRRMPQQAVADFVEWTSVSGDPAAVAETQFDFVLRQEGDLRQLIAGSPQTPALTDDRPINEYYLLRKGSLEDQKQ